jgi:hypothetical protein
VTSQSKQVSVVISKDGPYIVSGDAPLSEEIIGSNSEGESSCIFIADRHEQAILR